jgi:hypothetical protein
VHGPAPPTRSVVFAGGPLVTARVTPDDWPASDTTVIGMGPRKRPGQPANAD